MTVAVHDRFENQPWPGSEGEPAAQTNVRRRAMRMVVERYILGQHVNLNIDLKELGSEKEPEAQMRGYWEFRSGKPRQQTRLFGFVPFAGAFIATGFKGRGQLGPRSDWHEQRRNCEKEWKALFGNQRPLRSPWPVTTASHLLSYLDRSDEH